MKIDWEKIALWFSIIILGTIIIYGALKMGNII